LNVQSFVSLNFISFPWCCWHKKIIITTHIKLFLVFCCEDNGHHRWYENLLISFIFLLIIISCFLNLFKFHVALGKWIYFWAFQSIIDHFASISWAFFLRLSIWLCWSILYLNYCYILIRILKVKKTRFLPVLDYM
jgi:hypothetical protein